MAKARSPNRDKAFEIWRESVGKISLKEIAMQLSISDTLIRKWKNLDQWEAKLNGNVTNKIEESNGNVTNENTVVNGNVTIETKKKPGGQPGNKNAKGHGPPLGNDNAKGNSGGAPIGNKNALITGKYERIFKDCLDEEEQEACADLDTDELAQINLELELLTVRERRMMKRIINYEKKKEDIEEKITQVVQVSTQKNSVYDEATGQMKDSMVTTLVPKEMVQMKKSILDKLLRIEQHLTDIQAKKTRAIETKHRIVLARQEVGGSVQEDPFDGLTAEELRDILNGDD